jgi:hypothetical protein
MNKNGRKIRDDPIKQMGNNFSHENAVVPSPKTSAPGENLQRVYIDLVKHLNKAAETDVTQSWGLLEAWYCAEFLFIYIKQFYFYNIFLFY